MHHSLNLGWKCTIQYNTTQPLFLHRAISPVFFFFFFVADGFKD